MITSLYTREAAAAGWLLGRAFRDNPLNLAVMPRRGPASRVRANAAGLRCQLRTALRHGEVLAARERGELRGVLVAVPPLGHPPPLPPLVDRLRALAIQGPRAARRWERVAEALGAVHPWRAHWYLSVLGVDPAHAGRGIGTALVQRFVARADQDHLPAYLETDVEANLAFYARAGFGVEGELRVLGVRVWRMNRPARAVP